MCGHALVLVTTLTTLTDTAYKDLCTFMACCCLQDKYNKYSRAREAEETYDDLDVTFHNTSFHLYNKETHDCFQTDSKYVVQIQRKTPYVLRKMRKSTFILKFSVSSLKIFANLKSKDSNTMNMPGVLSSADIS